MNELVSPVVFKWSITLITFAAAGTWFVYDALKLYWLRRADRKDPVIRDKQFGYAMGVVIGGIGVLGLLLYHGVL